MINKECRELLDEIRQNRLWEKQIDVGEVLGIKGKDESEINDAERFVRAAVEGDSDSVFCVIRHFRSENALNQYRKKLSRLRDDVVVNVNCGWHHDEWNTMFWMDCVKYTRSEHDILFVIRFVRNTARFLFDVWEPEVSRMWDLSDEGVVV